MQLASWRLYPRTHAPRFRTLAPSAGARQNLHGLASARLRPRGSRLHSVCFCCRVRCRSRTPHPHTAVSHPTANKSSARVPRTPCGFSFEALRPFGREERQLARPSHPRTAGAVVCRGSCLVLTSSWPLGVSWLANLLCSLSRATTRKRLLHIRIETHSRSVLGIFQASVAMPGIAWDVHLCSHGYT